MTEFIQYGNCLEMITRNRPSEEDKKILHTRLAVGFEDQLPFEDKSFDLVLTNLALHWVNDLPQTFAEINRVLKPDGVLMGCMLGGATLQELRSSFSIADQERQGGVSSHISPMVKLNELGDMLSQAKFKLITIDNESINVPYPDFFTLCSHLQGM
eukprot:UN33640